MKNEVSGRFKIEAVDASTGERRTIVDWFNNLITDAGLDRMGVDSFMNRCHVGSGSTEPSVLDTGLVSPVAETNVIQSATYGRQSASPYYGWYRTVFRFAPGVATGNLSEVGIFWASGNSSAFSRALIKDGSTPITITVLASDYLDVTYEFRMYPSEVDTTFTTVIAGVTHTCVARACSVTGSVWGNSQTNSSVRTNSFYELNGCNAYSGDLGLITSQPSGTYSRSVETNLPYVSGSYQRKIQLDWGLTSANYAGGIKSLTVDTTLGKFQCNFTPTIAKPVDNTKTLRLTTYVSWARKTL